MGRVIAEYVHWPAVRASQRWLRSRWVPEHEVPRSALADAIERWLAATPTADDLCPCPIPPEGTRPT